MKLEITKEDGSTEVFETYERKFTIGRGSDAQCQVKGEGISRKHLLVEAKGHEVYITDLGSANGTLIQEEKLPANTPKAWTSLFPVKLGADTIIALLPDTEAINNPLGKIATGMPGGTNSGPSNNRGPRDRGETTANKKSASKKISPTNLLIFIIAFFAVLIYVLKYS